LYYSGAENNSENGALEPCSAVVLKLATVRQSAKTTSCNRWVATNHNFKQLLA